MAKSRKQEVAAMEFLIGLFAVLFISSAQAQVPMTGGGKGTPAPAWTPASLPNLIAWYKADNDSTNVFSDAGCTTAQTTNAGIVNCWKDKSGNGYNLLNSSGGIRPLYILAGLDSKPTVSNVGSNGWLISATGVAMGTGTAGSGFVMGTLNTATLSTSRLVSYVPASSTEFVTGEMSYMFRSSTSTAFNAEKGTTLQFTGAATLPGLDTPTRMGTVADGSVIQGYVNGATAGTSGSGSNAFVSGGCIAFGVAVATNCVTAAAGYWRGSASEIVITNNAMSAPNIALLDAYLAARW
jgi:hypothetical protein